jgi:hypothetical protein
MNIHLIDLYNATGLGRVVDSLKFATGGNSDLPLADVLVISRVLFAVVMIGFVGHFFDNIKQSLFAVKSEAKAKDFPRR